MDGKVWRRGKVVRFTALRRETYLEVLAATGNRTAAAAAIGVLPYRMRAMRRRDPALDADCEAAIAAASERLGAAEDPFEGLDDAQYSIIRRSRGGRLQVIAAAPGRWSKELEERFLAILAHCGNVEKSARAVGFSGTDMFRRRREWPGFARRWEAALEEAEVRLEFRLACWGNDVGTVTSNCPRGGSRTSSPGSATAAAMRDRRHRPTGRTHWSGRSPSCW